MLSFVYNAVQQGEHVQILSLLAYEFFRYVMGVTSVKIIFVVILSFEVALVSSPIL